MPSTTSDSVRPMTLAFHDARKTKEAMDDAERRAIAMQEAEELAAVQMAQVDAASAAAAGDATE